MLGPRCLPFYFYPRPPRGGRLPKGAMRRTASRFLSTPSARRATYLAGRGLPVHSYFYPRPPRGGRPVQPEPAARCRYFYPRPPRGGRPRDGQRDADRAEFLSTPSARRATCGNMTGTPEISGFLSTPSARRATPIRDVLELCIVGISIHALREEGDKTPIAIAAAIANFYPRPPRGGRHFRFVEVAPSCIFLSTPSARRATAVLPDIGARAENFYPRPPRGGRLELK